MAKKQKPKYPLNYVIKPILNSTIGRLFPTWAGNSAYKIWLKPMKFPAPEREKEFMQSGDHSFIHVENMEIRVWSWGQGPVIFFVHGWGGRGTQISSYIETLVNYGYRVVSFDMPAHGESSGTHTDMFNISKVIKTIWQDFDEVHAVITHSFGGMVFSFCYEPSMVFNKLVMMSPPATMHTPINHFSRVLKLSKRAKRVFTQNLKQEFGDSIFEVASLENNIQKFIQPILVVQDADDSIVPVKDGYSLEKRSNRVQMLSTREIGHYRIVYDEKIAKKVIAFISAKI